jgi:hypothetical protein
MYTLWFPIDETLAPGIRLMFAEIEKPGFVPRPSTKKESRFLNENRLAWNSKICYF